MTGLEVTMASSHDIVSHPFAVTFIRIKARQLCRRCDFSRSDYDDLRQAMRLYLLQKAHLFDAERGNLESFITKTLKTWVAMRLRYQDREKRRDVHKTASLERTTVECDGEITRLGAALIEEDGQRLAQTQPLSSLDRLELRDALATVIKKLAPEDRKVLAHVAEYGARSAVRSLGVSRRRVEKVMARVRELCESAGLDS
jgi:RNA polymerase sigma factor (sigma-70 family)